MRSVRRYGGKRKAVGIRAQARNCTEDRLQVLFWLNDMNMFKTYRLPPCRRTAYLSTTRGRLASTGLVKESQRAQVQVPG